ncbi:MAG TPA: DUF2442 domain-containing protein [Pyrinomonadaceae bacterium]|nr:DUF2442 domain-containing protein [Pyrinomonadaceae bacterium]
MAGKKFMKGEVADTLKEQIIRARQAAKDADAHAPRVASARYDQESDRIVIDLKNGATFIVPVAMLEGFADASPAELAEIEITPSRAGLHWEKLDADLSVPALLKGAFGSKTWMSELGKKGGSATSEAKASAARENGKKGGRPRKAS